MPPGTAARYGGTRPAANRRYDSDESFLALDRLPLPDYSRRGGKHQAAGGSRGSGGSCWPTVFKWLALILALLLAVVAGAVMVEQYYHGGSNLHATWGALTSSDPGRNSAEMWAKTKATDKAVGASTIKPLINVAEYHKVPEVIDLIRKAAAVLDPEVMSLVPAQFEPQYKNPCWNAESPTKRLRCLPYFYIAGSFHGGGSTMAQKLSVHPNIVTDTGTGDQFWAEDGKTMATYLDHFSAATERVIKDPAKSVIMDSSLSTFSFYWSAGMKAHRAFQRTAIACWKSCSDAAAQGGLNVEDCASKRCLQEALAEDQKMANAASIPYADQHMPLIMAAVYGKDSPRMVLVARDPVARLHSSYWGYAHYSAKHGKTAEGFLAYVKEQVSAFKACVATGKTDVQCALYFEALGWEQEKVFFHCDQLIRGMYSVFLEVWLRFLPRDHLLIIKSEEYFKDSKKYLGEVLKFLGLPEPDAGLLTTMDGAGQPISSVKGQPEMLPEARKILADFYKPYNLKFARLTGNPLFVSWNVHPGAGR